MVTVSGLSADTKYFYSVGNSAGELAGNDANHFFVSSPNPGTAKSTRLWILGDSGTANASARAVRDAFLNFTGTRAPDLTIMLGDNAYNEGTDNEYLLRNQSLSHRGDDDEHHHNPGRRRPYHWRW